MGTTGGQVSKDRRDEEAFGEHAEWRSEPGEPIAMPCEATAGMLELHG